MSSKQAQEIAKLRQKTLAKLVDDGYALEDFVTQKDDLEREIQKKGIL